MSDATDLQNAVNRFSSDPDIGFQPIAVDGIIGKQTAQATFWALTSIQNIPGDPLDAAAWLAQLNTPADIASSAASLAAIINSGAVGLSLPLVPAPAVASTPQAQLVPKTTHGAQIQAAIVASKPAVSASIFDAIPPWGPYALGGLALVSALYWVVTHRKQPRGGVRGAASKDEDQGFTEWLRKLREKNAHERHERKRERYRSGRVRAYGPRDI